MQDHEGTEDLDIMNMMKEPHSKSETEKSLLGDAKTDKNACTTFKKY